MDYLNIEMVEGGNFDVSRARSEVEQDLASILHQFKSGSQFQTIILFMLAAQ